MSKEFDIHSMGLEVNNEPEETRACEGSYQDCQYIVLAQPSARSS